MKSRTTSHFRKQFGALPEDIKAQARKSYRHFQRDPWHTSLHFKPIHPNLPLYSVRISKGYRAVGKRDEKGMLWYWIGSHNDYDKLLTQL